MDIRTFTCPACGERMPRELSTIIPHTEEHIIDVIKEKYPNWVDKDGICRKCYEYYKNQIHPR